jgi:hypothetical protein
MDALLVGVLAAWGIRDRIASVSIKRKIGLVRLTGLADADRSRELHHPRWSAGDLPDDHCRVHRDRHPRRMFHPDRFLCSPSVPL